MYALTSSFSLSARTRKARAASIIAARVAALQPNSVVSFAFMVAGVLLVGSVVGSSALRCLLMYSARKATAQTMSILRSLRDTQAAARSVNSFAAASSAIPFRSPLM